MARNELQPNPTYHSHIVVPASVMYGKDARTFWCIVYGSSIPSEISVHSSLTVNGLKEEIQRKKRVFRDGDPSNLVLLKLNVPEPVNPEHTLWQRIRQRGDVKMFVEELTISTQKLSSVFPQSQLPLEDHVYILVALPPDDTRSWLAVLQYQLWKEPAFFGKIFRFANLTEYDFKELQDLLDRENPGRSKESYKPKNVLAMKSDFLRKRSEPLNVDFGNGLVPRLVFDAAQPQSSDVVGKDAVADDDVDYDDAVADVDNDDDDSVADNAMDIDADHGYVGSHMEHLLNEATPIFPCTIRYMDLTVLDLENDLRVPPLMLFRNEWGTMIDIFNGRPEDLKGTKGSAIFTGQPGIGKTCLLYSILVLCMIRGQPFAFQDVRGKVFIIDDKGVTRAEDARAVPRDVDEVLTLVDADDKSFTPSEYLLINTKHRILLTSSPKMKKERRWLKQIAEAEHAVWVMEPWSRQEFVVASLFLQKMDITLERLQQVSHICGNIPRPCFNAALSPVNMVDAKNDIIQAIQNATVDLFDVIHNEKRGDQSHTAFQIRPSPKSRYVNSCLLQPISPWAFMKMLDVLHKKQDDNAFKFYCTIKGYPDSSQLRGKIFETYFHRYLKESRTFTIRPLDKGAATPEITFTVNKDSHLLFPDVKKLSTQLESSVKSNKSSYFRPESAVFPSFDSFLYQPEISDRKFSPVIGLQVTTAASHDIKVKGLQEIQKSLHIRNTILKNLRPGSNRKMIILFVVPNNMEKTFGMQEIAGKGAKVWYNKTAQYVLGVPEGDLFEFYGEKAALEGMQS